MFVGLLMVCAIVPTLVLMGVDTRTLNGVSVWMKPFKFQASLAVHLLTLSLLMLCIPSEKRRTVIVTGLVAVVLATSLLEIAYITLQAGRGEASHFNLSTPFTRAMYSMMGIAAVSLLVASGGIGLLILRYGRLQDPVVLAAGLGVVIGSVLGTMTGLYLGGQQGPLVGGTPTDADGLPVLGWSQTGGDLRVAHFLGLHTMQLLPLFALAIRGRSTAKTGRMLVCLAALLLMAMTGLFFVQARLGFPLIPIG